MFKQGRHRRAAEDVGRVRGRRQEDHRARRRQHRLRDAARPGGGAGRVLDLAVQQRRRLEDRRQVDDQLAQERRDADVPEEARRARQGHPEQPRQDQPRRRASTCSSPARSAWSSASRPLAGDLDKDKKVDYGVAPMPTKDGGEPQTFGVTDYLMAFKKPGNQEAVKAFYDLYYQQDQVNTFIKAEGFLPVTKTGLAGVRGRRRSSRSTSTPCPTRTSRRPTTRPGTRSSSPCSRTSAPPSAPTATPRRSSTTCRRRPRTAADRDRPAVRRAAAGPARGHRPRAGGAGRSRRRPACRGPAAAPDRSLRSVRRCCGWARRCCSSAGW